MCRKRIFYKRFFINKKLDKECIDFLYLISYRMVAQAGIEPATHGFSVVSCNILLLLPNKYSSLIIYIFDKTFYF